MFEIFDYWQGKLIIAAIVFLALSLGNSHDANVFINDYNERNSADYRIKNIPTAPFGSIIFVIILLFIALVAPLEK